MTEPVVAAFYHFAAFDVAEELLPGRRSATMAELARLGLKGSILLAPEGLNGGVAGPRAAVEAALDFFRGWPGFESLAAKTSPAEGEPFRRRVVKIKKEIVTLGRPEADPRRAVGRYLDAAGWNALVSRPGARVVDTRNDYEWRVGAFQGATLPPIASFREFPDWVEASGLADDLESPVAMYCTGGIRCEKATAYMLARGFRSVYHLEGGVHRYLETVARGESRWEGELYVFDGRVAIDAGLRRGSWSNCFGCGRPVSAAERESPGYRSGVSCPACAGSLTDDRRARFAARAGASASRRAAPRAVSRGPDGDC